MNKSITFTGDWALHGIMSDLGVDFALSPFHRIGFKVDEAGIQKLSEHYADRVFRARQWFRDEKLSWTTLLLRFEEKAFLVAHGDGCNWAEIIASSAENVRELHAEIRKVLHGENKPKQPAFFMLRYDYNDISADPIENLPEAVTDDFLRLCYGEDILEWVAQFGERTVARAGGLTIFDGPPGTGKTSLISEMIRRLEKTHVFYSLPVSQDKALSSPELVPFWQTQNTRHADRVKVIVMEDAERLLWRRTGDNREAVSSLLNIADGLMGRMLRLHIICSVNAKMEDLDPAVLRPGRLMNHRRFEPLSREAAERLAADRGLAFTPNEWSEGYSLAEVLNPGSHELANDKPSIGFQIWSR
ncbi:MAG TPA: AAA family ATPase [Chthoniobacterales bacterium]|nr:AAA family ATPase [Chthoniobacterales bacterium]